MQCNNNNDDDNDDNDDNDNIPAFKKLTCLQVWYYMY